MLLQRSDCRRDTSTIGVSTPALAGCHGLLGATATNSGSSASGSSTSSASVTAALTLPSSLLAAVVSSVPLSVSAPPSCGSTSRVGVWDNYTPSLQYRGSNYPHDYGCRSRDATSTGSNYKHWRRHYGRQHQQSRCLG